MGYRGIIGSQGLFLFPIGGSQILKYAILLFCLLAVGCGQLVPGPDDGGKPGPDPVVVEKLDSAAMFQALAGAVPKTCKTTKTLGRLVDVCHRNGWLDD